MKLTIHTTDGHVSVLEVDNWLVEDELLVTTTGNWKTGYPLYNIISYSWEVKP